MYQPYPSSGKPVEPERPPAPPSVLNAVKLMYAGAALSTVSLIIFLINIGGLKEANKKARPSLTASQLDQLIISSILYAVVGIGLWLWMARANGQGRNWARNTGTVLFAAATVQLFFQLNYPGPVIGLVFPVLSWLVGLGAVILLWRRESTAFFKPGQMA
jgi:tryptophan-rich sensory protein